MAGPEEGAAKRSRQLDTVPGADIAAQRRRHQAVGHLSDVKVQHAIVRAAFQRIGRAVGSCRKSLKLQLAILTGKVPAISAIRRRRRPRRRELNGLRHARRQGGRLGRRLDRNLEIGDDPRLAGMDHVVAPRLAAEHRAVDQAHFTGAADAGAAIVRKVDAIHQRPVEQQVAAIGEKRLVVDGYLAYLLHYSTSRRMGRTCLVCLIWL